MTIVIYVLWMRSRGPERLRNLPKLTHLEFALTQPDPQGQTLDLSGRELIKILTQGPCLVSVFVCGLHEKP